MAVFLIVRGTTILRGIQELSEADILEDRNRETGGGRLSVLEKQPDINPVFLQLLKEHTAGDPMDEKVKWTNLSCSEIADLLATKGFKVSRNIIRKLLNKHGYVKRKALKKSRQARILIAMLNLSVLPN